MNNNRRMNRGVTLAPLTFTAAGVCLSNHLTMAAVSGSIQHRRFSIHLRRVTVSVIVHAVDAKAEEF